MRPDRPRSPVAGHPTGPDPPFPIRLSGPIIKGFGRGSKELGIPTANIPIAGLSVGGQEDVESGVYYGWAGIGVDEEGNVSEKTGVVKAMVMSIGWNPYYKNSVRSVVGPDLFLVVQFFRCDVGREAKLANKKAGGSHHAPFQTRFLRSPNELVDTRFYKARV